MDIKVRFGQKIKALRIEKGLSQEALAHLAEIDRTYISGIEKGERNVSITVAKKITFHNVYIFKHLFVHLFI